jgi:hypothetical protein
VFGIKATGDQQRVGQGEFRHFSTPVQAWKSFAYLVNESSHYEGPREILDAEGVTEAFLRAFARIYCPDDVDNWTRRVGALYARFEAERIEEETQCQS